MIENFKLRVFRVVAETLSFRRAADELHLTQPAITAQVKSLEENLGIALFDRIGRDVNLTPAGKTLLEYARQIETLANDALAALAPLGGQQGVELSVGASHTIAVYLLPKLLAQLIDTWPKLRIHVVSGSTKDVLHALINHQVALALIEAPAFRPDLKVEAFGRDELTLIVHPGHRWANKRVLRAAELVQEPILLREIGSGMRHFVEEYLERNGVLRQQLRTPIDMTSTEAIISAVEAGLGAGFVPSVAVEKAVQLRAVRSIPLDNGPIKRELSTVLLNGPELRGPAGQLLELLHQNNPAIQAIQEPATNTPVAVRNGRTSGQRRADS